VDAGSIPAASTKQNATLGWLFVWWGWQDEKSNSGFTSTATDVSRAQDNVAQRRWSRAPARDGRIA